MPLNTAANVMGDITGDLIKQFYPFWLRYLNLSIQVCEKLLPLYEKAHVHYQNARDPIGAGRYAKLTVTTEDLFTRVKYLKRDAESVNAWSQGATIAHFRDDIGNIEKFVADMCEIVKLENTMGGKLKKQFIGGNLIELITVHKKFESDVLRLYNELLEVSKAINKAERIVSEIKIELEKMPQLLNKLEQVEIRSYEEQLDHQKREHEQLDRDMALRRTQKRYPFVSR